MNSRIEHRSFSVRLFISLPACCVFSGKDDRLVDVLLRVEDLAPPVTRTKTTILPTTTKNNNCNNKNINVLFHVEDHHHNSLATLLQNCLQRNQSATTTITQTGMFFSVTHLNIICNLQQSAPAVLPSQGGHGGGDMVDRVVREVVLLGLDAVHLLEHLQVN